MGEYGVATERNSWSAWLVGGLAVCTVVTGAGFGVYKGIRSSNRPVAVCETVHVQPPDCKL
jgi:hypothetical protein